MSLVVALVSSAYILWAWDDTVECIRFAWRWRRRMPLAMGGALLGSVCMGVALYGLYTHMVG